ncbi:hypothetical protein, partial [Nostoc commune]|uniref:hypothetical protein n=1 Tax=Nostoc commune TaxID=1178 RepID=UPI0018C4863C
MNIYTQLCKVSFVTLVVSSTVCTTFSDNMKVYATSLNIERETLKLNQMANSYDDQRLENERLENERLENERLENLRLENLRLENLRLENLRLENLRLENLRLENLRLEN